MRSGAIRIGRLVRECSRRWLAQQVYGSQHQPVEIRVKKKERSLEVDFDNGKKFRYPAEYLRVESPSAEVQGHGTNQKRLVAGRKYVGIMAVEPVGNYAIRIVFDDLHETGIYSWSYLYELGEQKYSKMKAYIKALRAAGKSRDPKASSATAVHRGASSPPNAPKCGPQ